MAQFAACTPGCGTGADPIFLSNPSAELGLVEQPGLSDSEEGQAAMQAVSGRFVMMHEGPASFALVDERYARTTRELTDYQAHLLGGVMRPIMPDRVLGVDPEQPLASLQDLGIQPGDMSLRMRRPGSAFLSPFMMSEGALELATAAGLRTSMTDASPVDMVNNKGEALASMARFGIPVSMGGVPRTSEEAFRIFDHIMSLGARGVIFKFSRSVSGMAVWAVQDKEKLAYLLSRPDVQFHMNTPGFGIRMEYCLDLSYSPNAMVYVGQNEETTLYLGSSAQILGLKEGEDRPTMYLGSEGPINTDDARAIRRVVKKVAQWMRVNKAYGLAGVDLGVLNSTKGVVGYKRGRPRVAVLEINFRFNGNTHILLLSSRLGFPFWSVLNKIPVGPDFSINAYHAALERQGAAFNPVEGGVVLACARTALDLGQGVVQVGVLADSPDKKARYARAAYDAGLDLF